MMTKIETFQEPQTPQPALRSLILVAPLAILVATVANLGLYAAAGNYFPEVVAWTGANLARIVGATIVYLLIGITVLAAVTRVSSHPVRHYLIVASLGLLLSLALPISAGFGYGPPDILPADVATVVTLCLMHLLSYVISVALFIRLILNQPIGQI